MQKSSLYGLFRLLGTVNGLDIKLSKINFNEMSEAILDEVNKPSKEELKPEAQNVLSLMYDKLNNKQKKQVEVFSFEMIKKSTNEDAVQQVVNFFNKSVDKSKPVVKEIQKHFMAKYNESKTVDEKRQNFIALTKVKSEEIPVLIKDILSDSKADISLKIIATWSAGFYSR